MGKTYTLKKNYEFKRVLDKGRYFGSNTIECFIKNNNKKYNRIGIAIGAKLFKAAKRNRIKRLIKENYRNNSLNLKLGYDIVFLWNRKIGYEEVEFKKIKDSMEKIFERARLLEK